MWGCRPRDARDACSCAAWDRLLPALDPKRCDSDRADGERFHHRFVAPLDRMLIDHTKRMDNSGNESQKRQAAVTQSTGGRAGRQNGEGGAHDGKKRTHDENSE